VLFWDGREDFDHFGVELGAGAAANFFAGMGHGESAAAGAVADHGVERVGDGENAGPEGDLFASWAARVAGAVEEFLVSEDDFGGVPEERDADKHVVADFAVLAHDLLFVVGKGTRFAENTIRDGPGVRGERPDAFVGWWKRSRQFWIEWGGGEVANHLRGQG